MGDSRIVIPVIVGILILGTVGFSQEVDALHITGEPCVVGIQKDHDKFSDVVDYEKDIGKDKSGCLFLWCYVDLHLP